MTKLRKYAELIIVICLILGILVFIAITSFFEEKQDTLKIGVLTPLSGEASQWGIPPKEGVELALQELREKKIANNLDIQVTYEDSVCDPATAVNAAQKLIIVDHVDVIIGAVCSSATLAIAPLAEKNSVVLISPASTSPEITHAGDYVFRVVPSDARRGKVFAHYLFEKDIRKVAFLHINNEAGVGGKNAFEKTFSSLLGEIITLETYEQGTKDVRSQLIKIKESSPDAIVIISHPADSIVIIKQVEELGISTPLYFQTEALDDPTVLEATGKSANGITYILAASPEGKSVEMFTSSFQRTFGYKPQLFAAEAYDAFNIIIDNTRDCKSNFAHCIKENLYTVQSYEGASGLINFDEHGDVLKPMAIMQIEHEEKKLVAKV